MITETYTLPESTLSYFINGDRTGYEEDDLKILDQFVEDCVQRHGSFHCLTDEKEKGFMKYHDLMDYGWGSSDCAEVSFSVDKK